MTGFLASVATLDEMEAARAGGADIVDLKDPARGALGAWEIKALQEAVSLWWSWGEPKPMLSATIGDRPMDPEDVAAAVERVASKGVPMVKIGLFPGGDPLACFQALLPLTERTRLIAVFLADAEPDFDLLPELAGCGFAGVMIDTADKTSGGLRKQIDDGAAGEFVRRARALGLMTGLAGSLKLEDVGPLTALGPDYLGFRGALCSGVRTGRMSPQAVARIRSALDARRPAA
ncbi:(5-formylfuran-3-yl)methyl phosphate synthase [Chenggangzhangella methanolivorans]|uniref:(5-formylfuran-3-yl)methyl phosphate synthase n=1 Tax=Chenggangzhangella methanolivorans TaxID=1437009 RepID=A0A9E6UPV5_9HYPH|nr:(5-formylfuran-3-yl)methyl phosphate synthase [Chenggangzhangella methanolivorans]QZO00185.1 (5-formylfuran-3-yl)methyl phosphate synthase [Chenggangzhangella methanolivorans]